jgi:hypothetical protein
MELREVLPSLKLLYMWVLLLMTLPTRVLEEGVFEYLTLSS